MSINPVKGVEIGEQSTGQVLASWYGANVSENVRYYVRGLSGERFLLTIRDGNENGFVINVFSQYANQFIIKLIYPDGTFAEKFSEPPRELLKCSLENMTSCTLGAMVPVPYRDCSRIFAGYVEIIVTDSGGNLKVFKQNVMKPLQKAPEWNAADVWIVMFRKVDKGYYAEIRITTHLCVQTVAQKIQGNPFVLFMEGRRLNIHYR